MNIAIADLCRPASLLCGEVRCGRDDGHALIETVLVFSLMIVLLVGAVDFGRVWYYSIAVENAAEAGASYGARSHETAGTPAHPDPSGNIAKAASDDGADVPGLSVQVPAPYCTCFYPDGSTVANPTCATPPASPCLAKGSSSTARSVEYVQVNTSATVTPIFNYPGLPASFSLSGHAVQRVGND